MWLLLHCLSCCVRACKRSSKYLWCWGRTSRNSLGVADHIETHPTCCHTNCCRSNSKDMRVRGGPKNLGATRTLASWDGKVADPVVLYVPLHMCHLARCGCSRSNSPSVITEIHRKNLTHRVPPFKVTQGHCNQHGSVGYLWLPINDP